MIAPLLFCLLAGAVSHGGDAVGDFKIDSLVEVGEFLHGRSVGVGVRAKRSRVGSFEDVSVSHHAIGDDHPLSISYFYNLSRSEVPIVGIVGRELVARKENQRSATCVRDWGKGVSWDKRKGQEFNCHAVNDIKCRGGAVIPEGGPNPAVVSGIEGNHVVRLCHHVRTKLSSRGGALLERKPSQHSGDHSKKYSGYARQNSFVRIEKQASASHVLSDEAGLDSGGAFFGGLFAIILGIIGAMLFYTLIERVESLFNYYKGRRNYQKPGDQ